MPIPFQEWIPAEEEDRVEVKVGTIGGDTYHLDGVLYCYNLTRPHYRAVRALTDDVSKDYRDIQDTVVDQLISTGVLNIDDSACWEDCGWLGVKVWDAPTSEFLGTVGNRCSLTAGWGTDHLGTGRCKLHGGADIAGRVLRKATHGLTSKYLRKRVEDKVDKYLADPAPLDLSREIATSRALLEFLCDWILDQGDVELFIERVPGLLTLIDNTGRLVDRAAMIEKRYVMTAAQVLYVESVFIDILNNYILDPRQREKIAAELAHRLGGTSYEVNLAMHPALVANAGG